MIWPMLICLASFFTISRPVLSTSAKSNQWHPIYYSCNKPLLSLQMKIVTTLILDREKTILSNIQLADSYWSWKFFVDKLLLSIYTLIKRHCYFFVVVVSPSRPNIQKVELFALLIFKYITPRCLSQSRCVLYKRDVMI